MKNKLKLILTSFVLLLGLSAIAQDSAKAMIKWISWDEAVEYSKVDQKKYFIDLYTAWCGWCKKMDETTFQNREIVNFINENFYPIKFDAQQKEPIELHGKLYKYRNGYNELAVEITMGNMNFPSLIFLDEKLETIQSIAGFRHKDELEMILVYFAGNYYMTTPWSAFQREYVKEKQLRIEAPQREYQPVKGH